MPPRKAPANPKKGQASDDHEKDIGDTGENPQGSENTGDHGKGAGDKGKNPERPEDTEEKSSPAMQVIVLGPTGGPREDRVTSLLVRSQATEWAPNSVVAVDAGTLLSPIIACLENCTQTDGVLTTGAFAGLPTPFDSAEANAVHIFRKVIGSVLITHAHLDHVAGLAMNTQLLAVGTEPKAVGALDSVIRALQTHIFNNVIWPNFSNENGGVGCLTYHRLPDGPGNMGMGDDAGYQSVCEGLLTQCFAVSHGKYPVPDTGEGAHSEREQPESDTGSRRSSPPKTPGQTYTTVDSSAFFLRDQETGTEILVFGDVEPDKLSVCPRNRRVWEAAAPKIISKKLRAIFIECSYVDAIPNVKLFGHLCPRHLTTELAVLADCVAKKQDKQLCPATKRKRDSPGISKDERGTKKQKSKDSGSSESSRSRQEREQTPDDFTVLEEPLAGLSVYILHVKENLDDGPYPGDIILDELKKLGAAAKLGCKFYLPYRGESIEI
ncbi:3',5'-cyclic-nucleotide phosphodiesterase PDE1 [Aspergillus stella-maris]|uniref:3',5'-cyclic-nucleotide phosphodiesterase PDE1 n=1 Tax=Aspergillus stella-maris TaxID=1810926 RepID=UPI003CCE1ACF